VTTTDSAQITPTAGGPVGVGAAERVGARAPAAVRAERRAWLVLWLAFVTFCALVFAVFKFTVEYVSTAEVDQSAHVTASRGQVVFSLPGSAERTLLGSRSDLGVGTVLSVDRSTVASADLVLFDDARLKLLGGASVELTRMEVGRFINQHSLLLTQWSGPVRYATAASPMEVQAPNGLVQLAAHGDYTVWLDGDVTRVLVYGGEARLVAGGASVPVAEGRRAEIDPVGQVHGSFERQMSLLANSNLAQRDQNWIAWDRPNSPLDVNGKRFWVQGADEVSTALRVLRESVKGEHGETGLIQPLDRDVSGFRHLWLKAMVRVDYADLSGGGTLGSEYPMMLRVKYEGPVEGSQIPWSVGLYYANPDNRPTEGFGEQWPQGEWKQYLVDLMDTEASTVPYRLVEFAVMGQGHSYDARIADISLVGD
jgi:hypothetical protein